MHKWLYEHYKMAQNYHTIVFTGKESEENFNKLT